MLSGPITDAPGETWLAAAMALRYSRRGLPGGSSLARLLAERRGVSAVNDPPHLAVDQILAWADAWQALGRMAHFVLGPDSGSPGGDDGVDGNRESGE